MAAKPSLWTLKTHGELVTRAGAFKTSKVTTSNPSASRKPHSLATLKHRLAKAIGHPARVAILQYLSKVKQKSLSQSRRVRLRPIQLRMTTSDQTTAVYIAALRHDLYAGRLRKVFWVDTRDLLSNGATKLDLKSDKHLDMDLYKNTFKSCSYRPKHLYRCNSKPITPG